MGDLVLAKSESFYGVQCDFWKNDSDNYFMTSEQLGLALGYSTPRESINKMVSRNEYLRNGEFSSEVKMTSEAGMRDTRVFTEDGIYEITMLAKTERAREFRAMVREILKGLRKGTVKAFKQIDPRIIEAREKNAAARLMNARRKDAEFLISQVSGLSPVAAQLIRINAIEMITGPGTLPRPEVAKTYSAGDIAAELGTTANMIGRIAMRNGLKTEQYGIIVLDKSRHSSKQVSSFRYNENGKQEIVRLFKAQ